MVPQYLLSVWLAAAPGIVNHLWQSTLFAAVAALLALLLRKDRANARYWLWLVSSLKFLFPFALLGERDGDHVRFRTPRFPQSNKLIRLCESC